MRARPVLARLVLAVMLEHYMHACMLRDDVEKLIFIFNKADNKRLDYRDDHCKRHTATSSLYYTMLEYNMDCVSERDVDFRSSPMTPDGRSVV